ncbi:MAG: hypothetical protein ACI93R_000165 [Flavobacteriales bacterium]|jgi:hypothetical protein
MVIWIFIIPMVGSLTPPYLIGQQIPVNYLCHSAMAFLMKKLRHEEFKIQNKDVSDM